MSRRLTWRRTVASTPFPVGLRPVKATLLALPVDSNGVLTGWRDELAVTVGIPLRTLDRHLARAVAAGWLAHDVHGGHGRRARYTIRFPHEVVARHEWHTTDVVARHPLRATTASCAPRGGELNKDTSASVSEHKALDETRQRESTASNVRVLRDAPRTEERSDQETPAGPPLVADSPRAVRAS